LLLGSPGGDSGALRSFLVLNVIVVAALWTAFRSARREQTPSARALMVTALAASILFAALSLLVVRFSRIDQDVLVRERCVFEPDGTYRRDVFSDPGVPLRVVDASRGAGTSVVAPP
jgi:hypothetical protein